MSHVLRTFTPPALVSLLLATCIVPATAAPATDHARTVPVMDREVFRGWEDTPLVVRGTADPHERVAVRIRREGSDQWTVRRVTADGSGRFGARVRSVAPRLLFVRARTDQGLSSRSKVVLAERRLRVRFGRERAVAGFGSVLVLGRLTGPAHYRVKLQVSRHGGRWRRLGWVVPSRRGTFRTRFSTGRPGTYAVRAVSPGPRRGTFERSLGRPDRVAVRYLFRSRVDRSVTAHELGASWRPGCPVGPQQLSNLTVTYRSFTRPLTVRRGTLVVHDDAVRRVRGALRRAFAARFPIRRITPASAFGGDDFTMMAADTTSAFNCRGVSGGSGTSPHSYGWSVDINPRENPYHAANGQWYPKNGLSYINRSHHRRGMLYRGSAVTVAFLRRGYQWGGVWAHRDYQHFDLRSSVARDEGHALYPRGEGVGD